MRRKDREVTGLENLMQIINQCQACRLGLADGNQPYVVPMNFGAQVENGRICIYLHCAKEGRRLDVIRQNPRACVEFDREGRVLEGDIACAHSFTFESAIGFGEARILESHEEKAQGLDAIHRHMTGKVFSFTPEMTESVAVVKVELEEATGKRREG